MLKEALLYEKLKNEKVRCKLCERRCVIENNRTGYCKTRKNINGRLYTLVYGDLSAIESRPIEIKPFYHYYPGTSSMTFSTWSCNFPCPWCQNWHISKAEPKGSYISPEEVVSAALRAGDRGLCASFQEPTLLFEFCIDTFKLGKKEGLYSCYVSNGYMSIEALEMLKNSGMSGINIDVKGDEEVYRRILNADVNVVWRNAEKAKKLGMHVEIVCLIVTGINDSEDFIEWVVDMHLRRLGEEIPIHFNRYYPAYKYRREPTPLSILEKAYRTAKREGISYVYIGNVNISKYESTYCPSCGELLIKRHGYRILSYKIKDKKCPKCGREIYIFD